MQGRSLVPLLAGSRRGLAHAMYYRYYHDPGRPQHARALRRAHATHKLIYFWKKDQWELYRPRERPATNCTTSTASADRVAHETLKAELARLKREMRDDDQLANEQMPNGVDGPIRGCAGAEQDAHVARNLHHAARRLRRAPLFTITSVLTLTIGIGACALMMSLVSTILLKPLPYAQAGPLGDNLGMLSRRQSRVSGAADPRGRLQHHSRQYPGVPDNGGISWSVFNLGDVANPVRLDGVQATGEFFQTLGVAPEIGRFFERANETPGRDHVAVLSDAAWRRRFGGDPHIIGHVITLNAEPYTVIGVAARGFAFPRGSEIRRFQFARCRTYGCR